MEDGSIEITIFRKKTHTDRYLHFTSHHPSQHKVALIRTLFDRADRLLSDNIHQDQERTHIGKALSSNGYPKQFIRKHSRSNEKRNQSQQKEDPVGFVVLPYVHGVTERIQRVLGQYNIKSCVKPHQTLRQILSKPKDVVPADKKAGVVYMVPCAECDALYIGETGRSLSTRKKEHEASVRLCKPEKSALAEHAIKKGHSIAWNSTKVLVEESRWHQRKWHESLLIAKNTNSITNRDSGRILPNNYIPLINKC